MRRTSKIDSRIRRSPRPVSYRPNVELLEDRLPPGDVLLGWGLLGSRLGQSTGLGAESPRPIGGQAETQFGHDVAARSSPWVGADPRTGVPLFPWTPSS